MRAVILANGVAGDLDFLRKGVSPRDALICCDGGARYAEALGVLPDFLIGDMDSVLPETLEKYRAAGVRLVPAPSDKDYTDLELAIMLACQLRADHIDIFGALGGRMDHAMANACVLLQAAGAARILEPGCAVYAAGAGRELAISGNPGDIVSILPVKDTLVAETDGLAWPLARARLYPGYAVGMSNVMTSGAARISVETGALIVFHNFHNLSHLE